MATLLEDIGAWLPVQIPSLTFGTNLIAGLVPADPDVCTSIFEYDGEAPEYVFGARTLPQFTKPHLQVLTRGAEMDYIEPRRRIETVGRMLETVTNMTINGTLYQRIERVGEPMMLHRDVNRRVLFVWNFAVTQTPS